MDYQKLQASPQAFRDVLIIEVNGEPTPLSAVVDDWQQADFQALDAAWKSVVSGKPNDNAVRRAWLERGRGHSKSSDLAVQASWALFASVRRINGVCVAADRDQARLLRDAIDRLVRLNPWLSRIFDVQVYKVRNKHTNSELHILASDAGSSYGLLVDFAICDELCHWQSDQMWTSLISTAAKKPHCLLVSITNAGFQGWQWDVREQVRKDPNWYFNSLDGPQASWISAEILEEQRRLLPQIAFDRLWMNRWSSGSGDALTEDEIKRAITLSGPTALPEEGWSYVCGVDLGLSRDRAAVAVVAKHVGHYAETLIDPPLSDHARAMIDAGVWNDPTPEVEVDITEATGRLKLIHLEIWNPKDSGGTIDLEEVENAILSLDRRFNLQVGCDVWQAAYLIQRLQKSGVATEPIHFASNSLMSMASAVLESFRESLLDLYPDPHLLQDLRNLKVVEKSYGIRLESPRGPSGHGDAATALAIALHLAKNSGNSIATVDPTYKLIAY